MERSERRTGQRGSRQIEIFLRTTCCRIFHLQYAWGFFSLSHKWHLVANWISPQLKNTWRNPLVWSQAWFSNTEHCHRWEETHISQKHFFPHAISRICHNFQLFQSQSLNSRFSKMCGTMPCTSHKPYESRLFLSFFPNANTLPFFLSETDRFWIRISPQPGEGTGIRPPSHRLQSRGRWI